MKNLKLTLVIAFAIFGIISIFSLFTGMLQVSTQREFEQEQCHYKSYASKYNPAFRLGCELFKVRY